MHVNPFIAISFNNLTNHFKISALVSTLENEKPRLDAWDKRSDLVHWKDLEGAGGERGGRGDRDGEHM